MLLGVLLLSSVLGQAQAVKKPQCEVDTDCALAYRCSCDCCRQLEPMTQAANRAERSKCSRMGPCGNQEMCASQGPCPKPLNPAAWQAVCREGRCASERKPKPDAGHP